MALWYLSFLAFSVLAADATSNYCIEEIKNSVIANAKPILETTAENHHLCLLACLADRKNDCQFAVFGNPPEAGKNGTCKLYSQSQKHMSIQRKGKDQTVFKVLTECPKESESAAAAMKLKGKSAYGSFVTVGSGGHWGPWSAWSECVADCTGLWTVQTRVRTCGICGINHAIEVESQPCGAQWGPWTAWSTCSASCGQGIRRRSRVCGAGPNACAGLVEETATCMIRPCARWSEWGAWAECSATCGEGVQKRFRQCIGEDVGGTICVGPAFLTRPCPSLPPCCTQWTPFGPCSATCGNGVQIRTRKCGTQLLKEDKPCFLRKCPRWSDWGSWAECSVTCGRGRRTRTRQCIDGVAGRDCIGEVMFADDCFKGPCPVWSPWQPWTPCSAHCGEGTRVRQRKCLHGNDCVGPARQSKVCYQCPCPEWSPWNPWEDCEIVRGKPGQSRMRICCGGCPPNPHACPGNAVETRPCTLPPTPGLGGSADLYAKSAKVGEWSEWSECDVKCGTGKQMRKMPCAKDDAECKPEEETKECKLEDCPAKAKRAQLTNLDSYDNAAFRQFLLARSRSAQKK